MKNLQLSLKRKWFEMTKAGIKTEDYREINDYWCRRLLRVSDEIEWDIWQEIIEDLNNPVRWDNKPIKILGHFGIWFTNFNHNIMTLGYPKKDDTERIIRLEHKGIEIRKGNPEWGAELGKLYFVIRHGSVLA
jgi:hypothetical protein